MLEFRPAPVFCAPYLLRAFPMQSSLLKCLTALAACAVLQGCTVIALADTVGTVAVRTAGAAANAAISTASTAAEVSAATTKLGVKVVGAVVDAAASDK
jgi:uncharacterized protein YunC (DUF1805 family)